MRKHADGRARRLALAWALIWAASRGFSAEPPDLAFEMETLANGLRVVYAPLPESTAAHVRVLYHVGSKDESPDRRGFAHLFEHMMFRGSAHVGPEEHMRLVSGVGGWANAYTSFDETVYVNTVPASQVELALWLEAERMAGFRVTPAIFATERKVVEEEWRARRNSPYGELEDVFCAALHQTHHYRWPPIGDMEQLRAADARELADFHARYYVPNNAVLVVAGGMDLAAAKAAVDRYFAWIPRGADIARISPAEPEPAAPRRKDVTMAVPLPLVARMFPTPPRGHPDEDALEAASAILGDGRASRLRRALVTGQTPMCMEATAQFYALEDGGAFAAVAVSLPGKDLAAVEAALKAEINRLATEPAAPEELARVKMAMRLAVIGRLRTAESVAGAVGQETLYGGTPDRVNTDLARAEAVTAEDVMRVVRTYLIEGRSATVVVRPDSAAVGETLAAAPPATDADAGLLGPEIAFPDNFPSKPPETPVLPTAKFNLGVEAELPGARLVTLTDRRLPLATLRLALPGGSDTAPRGLEGLAELTAEWVRRGPAGETPDDFNARLEKAGVTLSVEDGGDHTWLTVRFPSDPESREVGLTALRDILSRPALDPGEFAKIRDQARADSLVGWADSDNVAGWALDRALYGIRPATPLTLDAATPEQAREYFATRYRRNGAIMAATGDVTPEEARMWAGDILAALPEGAAPRADYRYPWAPEARRVILIDHPAAKQAVVRLGMRAYTVASDDKFAGSIAGTLLSGGLHARLGKFVRAEKGLAYGVSGYFSPGRHRGEFVVDLGTKTESAREAVDACFAVLNGLRDEPPGAEEMEEVGRRVSGSLLLGMQTVDQQGNQRLTGMLNGYPADYYDRYAARIGAVTAEDVREVMRRYVDENRTTAVVVAPAARTREALEGWGPVTVLPMPEFPEPADDDGGDWLPAVKTLYRRLLRLIGIASQAG